MKEDGPKKTQKKRGKGELCLLSAHMAGLVTVGSVLQLHDEVVDHGHDVTALARASHKVRDHQHSRIFVFEITDPVGDQSGLPTATFPRQEQNRLISRKRIYSEK